MRRRAGKWRNIYEGIDLTRSTLIRGLVQLGGLDDYVRVNFGDDDLSHLQYMLREMSKKMEDVLDDLEDFGKEAKYWDL